MFLKTLGAGDWVRYRDIRLRALGDTPNAFARTLSEEQAFSEERWRSRLSGKGLVVVAEVRGRDAGLVGGAPLQGRAGAACLVSMWVAPDHRRSGTGRALVQAVSRGRGMRVSKPSFWTWRTRTPAPRPFMSGLGFAETVRRGHCRPPEPISTNMSVP